MTILFQKRIMRDDLKRNPKVLYLFGDNDQRAGFGGQAKECRGEPNAVGIRTKKRPSKDNDAYYTDSDLATNQQKLDQDFNRVYDHVRKGGVVVIPIDGIGTGLSGLQTKCPKTFAYLTRKIDGIRAIIESK